VVGLNHVYLFDHLKQTIKKEEKNILPWDDELIDNETIISFVVEPVK
jgi:hypothetical protein